MANDFDNKPCYGINGSAPQVVLKRLSDTVDGLTRALFYLKETAPNSRDYTHSPDALAQAEAAFAAKVKTLEDMMTDLYQQMEQAYEQM